MAVCKRAIRVHFRLIGEEDQDFHTQLVNGFQSLTAELSHYIPAILSELWQCCSIICFCCRFNVFILFVLYFILFSMMCKYVYTNFSRWCSENEKLLVCLSLSPQKISIWRASRSAAVSFKRKTYFNLRKIATWYIFTMQDARIWRTIETSLYRWTLIWDINRENRPNVFDNSSYFRTTFVTTVPMWKYLFKEGIAWIE